MKTVLQLRLLAADSPPLGPGFVPRSKPVSYVVDKAALGKVTSENFGFLCYSFIRLIFTIIIIIIIIIIIYHPRPYQ
jgi:hypothetical protein